MLIPRLFCGSLQKDDHVLLHQEATFSFLR